MNILIENAASQEFFTGEGAWTKNVVKAKCYAGTIEAFQAAKQEPVGKFNIAGYIVANNQLINLRHGRGTGAQIASE